MPEFQLFNIRVIFSRQTELLSEQPSRAEIIKNIINKKPTVNLGKRSVWHIGNVIPISSSVFYFRFGKSTETRIEVLKNGDFSEEPYEEHPSTHVFIDVKKELLAIARKPKLAKAVGIAKKLERLLNEKKGSWPEIIHFEIQEINDPTEFLEEIRKAKVIRVFRMDFRRPNPFRSEDIWKPLGELLQDSGGEKGLARLTGENLNKSVIEEVTKSAAPFGDTVSAIGIWKGQESFSTKSIAENPVVVSIESDLESNDEKKSAWAELLKAHGRFPPRGGI